MTAMAVASCPCILDYVITYFVFFITYLNYVFRDAEIN